ncbi:MAG: PQQ-binding-like beta-propeller repeat protein, partial [Pirellulaceae bacterium]|nr:PQQ-binding-like beta-propeller repeat protein [Pirellulaceae bacterium]
ELGGTIIAWCCDADTGETIWKQRIVGDYPLRLSGCFSDSSAPPPVTDGQRVCFFNASGRIACFDMDGKRLWQNSMMPVGRTQPFLVGDNVVFIKQSYMPDQGLFTHDHKDAPVEKWTQLQALNLATGKRAWNTTCGVNMGCVPLPMTLPDGREVIVVGRGGGHSPPENPDGVSMVNAADGETVWSRPLPKFMSTMTFNVYGDHVLVFDGPDHLWLNATTGDIDRRVSIVDKATAVLRDQPSDAWTTETVSIDPGKKNRMIIQQSNVLAGRYHYFRSYTQPWLGRVNVVNGNVEYLQLPVQLKRTPSDPKDQLLWDQSDMDPKMVLQIKKAQRKKPATLPIQLWTFQPNTMENSSGFVVMGDARSQGNGWGHHASQLPTIVGDYLYVPTMAGTVYVIRHNDENLSDESIVSINDLGQVGDAFNRASLSYSLGRLYAHTIKDVICIQ